MTINGYGLFCDFTTQEAEEMKELSGKAPSPTVFALISTKWGEDTFNYLVGETNTMPEPTQTNGLPEV